MISKRQQLILKAIVEEFVKTAEPVGSKIISKMKGLEFSSATIRNEMVVLEEAGLILKTHTSSGRIPSEKGYRLYVKLLLESKDYKKISFPLIDQIFTNANLSREDAIKETMSKVTELTNYATLVLGASGYNSIIKKLEFVKISENQAVLILVTDKGYVESKKIFIPDSLKANDLEKITKVLNDILYNCPIFDIDRTLNEKIGEENIRDALEYYDEVVGVLVRTFTQMAQDKYFLSGQSNILKEPEFQNPDKMKLLLDALENQEILRVVNLNHDGVTVKIGTENIIEAMHNCTVITIPFEDNTGEKGAIAVIGPTRMEYYKIIPLLEYIAKNIKNIK